MSNAQLSNTTSDASDLMLNTNMGNLSQVSTTIDYLDDHQQPISDEICDGNFGETSVLLRVQLYTPQGTASEVTYDDKKMTQNLTCFKIT